MGAGMKQVGKKQSFYVIEIKLAQIQISVLKLYAVKYNSTKIQQNIRMQS